MIHFRRLLLATAAGCAIAATGAIPADLSGLGPTAAFAKNDNGNGNGNDEERGNGNDRDEDHGNGNGRNDDGGDDRGNGNGKGNSDDARGNGNADETRGNGNGNGNGNGGVTVANAETLDATQPAGAGPQSLDARAAGLHAVNANLQAFIHASPNSRVGEIAAYAMAVVGEENAEAAVTAAQTEFDNASLALNDASAAFAEDAAVLTDQYGYTDTSAVALQDAKDALLLTDTSQMTPEEVAALNAEIAAIDEALASAADVETAQIAYNDAETALTEATDAAAEAEALAIAALDEAANANRVPVDADVKLFVDTQLEAGGILDYYRAQAPAPVTP
jgi:hypothetical protein